MPFQLHRSGRSTEVIGRWLAVCALAGSLAPGCVVSPKAPDGLLGPDSAAQAWTRLGPVQRRLVEGLARVTEADARDFLCTGAAAPSATEFAQALFQLRTADPERGAILSLLWGHEPGGWRLLSYDIVDP